MLNTRTENQIKIAPMVNSKIPELDREESIVFSTADGDVLFDDPSQLKMDLKTVKDKPVSGLKIFVGYTNKKGDTWTTKQDATTEILFAVAEHAIAFGKPFKPKQGEIYYSITQYRLGVDKMRADRLDHGSILNGNCFRTESDAQAWLDAMKNALDD